MIATFNYQEFLPIDKIAAKKKQSGLSISVVIPSLNESSTIGTIISLIRSRMLSTKIIDEIIVMDCNSEDATVNVAQVCGAKVYQVAEVAPDLPCTGKGVALWKSQFVASGDILLFIDSDILDFDERFIIGLAGALIEHPELELVKSSYRRPLISDDKRIEDFGGRVTELMVRPLINLFIPSLADVRQPLAGECAVRRKTISEMRFYSGYGVEIGLLLEYYFRKNIASIGQVEMEIRTHRNRSLPELSKMAFEIEHVFFNYLEQQDCCTIHIPRGKVLLSWEKGIWSNYSMQSVLLPPANEYESCKYNLSTITM